MSHTKILLSRAGTVTEACEQLQTLLDNESENDFDDFRIRSAFVLPEIENKFGQPIMTVNVIAILVKDPLIQLAGEITMMHAILKKIQEFIKPS